MRLLTNKKTIFGLLILLAVTGVFVSTVSFNLTQDRLITGKVKSQLQKALKPLGLEVNVGNIRWLGWGGFRGTALELKDIKTGQIQLSAKEIQIYLNPFQIAGKLNHPEVAIRKVVILRPVVQVTRFADGTLSIQKYLPKRKRKTELSGLFEIRDGVVNYRDFQYGNHHLEAIRGTIDFRSEPLIKYQVSGKADALQEMRWKAKGDLRLTRNSGRLAVMVQNASVSSIKPFLPQQYRNWVKTGSSDFVLNFIIRNQKVSLLDGRLTLVDSRLDLPKIGSGLWVNRLQARINPERFQLDEAKLRFKGAPLEAKGQFNTADLAIQLAVQAKRVKFEDFNQLFSNSQVRVRGLTDLQIKVAGTLKRPLFNGTALVRDSQVEFGQNQRIDQISGRLRIVNNHLKVDQLTGRWGEALVGVSGAIGDVFRPRLALDVFGKDINLQSPAFNFRNLQRPDLQLGKVDFSGTVSGVPNQLVVTGALETDRIQFQNFSAKQTSVKLRWNAGTPKLLIEELRSEPWDSVLVARGEVLLNPNSAVWEITGDVTDLDLSRVSATEKTEKYHLQGTASANLLLRGSWRSGQPFDPGVILGIFQAESLRWQGFAIDQTNGIFSWNHGAFSLDSIQGNIDNGKFYGHLIYEESQLRADFNVADVQLRKLMPDEKKYPVDGNFNGILTFNGPVANPIGLISGQFTDLSWGSKVIGEVKGDLRYANKGLETTDLQIVTDSGDYKLQGRLAWEDSPQLQLVLESDNIKLLRFWKMLPANSDLGIAGMGKARIRVAGPVSDPKFQGTIELANPSYKNFQMERGVIDFTGDLQKLELKQFVLSKGDSRVEVTGKISAAAWDLHATSNAFDLELLGLEYNGKTLKGNVKFAGNLVGDIQHPMFNGNVSGTGLNFGAFDYQNFAADIIWNLQGLEIKSAQLDNKDSALTLYGRIENTKPIQLNLGIQVISCDLQELMQLGNFTSIAAVGKLSGMVNVTGTLERPLVRMIGELPGGSVNGIPVQGNFDVSYTQNKLNIEKVELRHASGTLLASGVWERDRTLKLKTFLNNFPLQIINLFVKSDYKCDGIANSEVNLEWTGNRIAGDYQIAIPSAVVNQKLLGDLRLRGIFSDQGFEITEGRLVNQGGSLDLKGYAPWPAELSNQLKLPVATGETQKRLNIGVGLKMFPAEVINIAARNFTITKGTLSGELRLTGAILKPVVFGNLSGNSLGFSSPSLPVAAQGLEGVLTFKGDTAEINSLQGTYGTGRFSLAGSINIANGIFNPDLNITFNGSRIYYKSLYFDGYSTLNVGLTGSITKPVITGQINVNNCRMGILGIQGKKKSSDWNPTLDLSIKTGKNVRYRQYGLADVAVEGEIHLKGPLKAPVINGAAKSKTGVLTVYGQTFKVNSGEASFENAEGFVPMIDVESNLKTSSVEVFLSIKGQIGGNLFFNLNSQPFLSQSELFALLNWSELNGERQFTFNGAVSGNISAVTDTLFGDVFYEIRRALKVDYFYLEQDYREKKFRINVGDYITDQLFLSYSRFVTDEPEETWGLDYNLTPNLLAGGTYSVDEGTSIRLIYRFHF